MLYAGIIIGGVIFVVNCYKTYPLEVSCLIILAVATLVFELFKGVFSMSIVTKPQVKEEVIRHLKRHNNQHKKGLAQEFEATLNGHILGQKSVVNSLVRGVVTHYRNSTQEKADPPLPYPVLILGATSTGKTELARQLFKLLDPLGYSEIEIINASADINTLFGTPMGVYGDEGVLPKFSKRNNGWGFVLGDEMEKWFRPDLPVALPMNDLFGTGFATSIKDNKPYNLRNTIWVFTSNYEAEYLTSLAVKYRDDPKKLENQARAVIKDNLCSPEFLERVKKVLVMEPISQEVAVTIAQRAVDKVISKHSVKVEEFDSKIISKAIIDSNPEQRGARAIFSWVNEHVSMPLNEADEDEAASVKLLMGESEVRAEIVRYRDDEHV